MNEVHMNSAPNSAQPLNVNFVVYSLQTGEILQHGSCDPSAIPLYNNGKVAAMESGGADRTHFVDLVTGVVIPYSDDEMLAKASMPRGWTWKMPERIAIDMRPLDQAQSAAIGSIDAHADSVRLSYTGDSTRIKEYERAQQHAEEYRETGYSGDIPSSVACWSAAKQWTPREACDDILAAAERSMAALDVIRAARLLAKEDVRRATDSTAIASIIAAFPLNLNAALTNAL